LPRDPHHILGNPRFDRTPGLAFHGGEVPDPVELADVAHGVGLFEHFAHHHLGFFGGLDLEAAVFGDDGGDAADADGFAFVGVGADLAGAVPGVDVDVEEVELRCGAREDRGPGRTARVSVVGEEAVVGRAAVGVGGPHAYGGHR